MNYPQKSKFIVIISLLIMLICGLFITSWLFNLLVRIVLTGVTILLLNKVDEERARAEGNVIAINSTLEKKVEESSSQLLNTAEELALSQEKYHLLIEQASDAIYIIDLQSNFTEVNASMCRITGYTREELLRLKVTDILDPEHLKTNPIVHGPNDLQTAVTRERRFVKKNGELFDAEVNVKRFVNERVLVIARDITNRKLMEAELKEAELKFRTLAEKSMVGVYIVQKGKFTYVNPRFAQIFGYSTDEIIAAPSVDIIINDDYKQVTLEHVRARLAGEVDSVHYEAKGRCKDGSVNWVEFYGNSVLIDCEPTIIGSMIDINNRKKAEEELRQSEQKYKLLFDSNPLPMWMIAKADLAIIAANAAASRLYGYSMDEFVQMNARDLTPKEDWDDLLLNFDKETPASGNLGIHRHCKKDQSVVQVQIIAQDIMFEGRLVRLSLANDVTEKLKAEEMLQKSEANLQTILNTTETAYALFDGNLKVLAFNPTAAKFVKEQYNHNPQKGDKLNDYFPQERFPQFEQFTEHVLKGNNISYEIDYPQPNGSVFWYYVRLFPIKDSSDNILGLMMALYDITERKNAENNLKVAYERIHNHITSIKNMAWKQSHFIRSPVANLKGLASMLKDDPTDVETLNYIITELNRLDTVIIEMADDASDNENLN